MINLEFRLNGLNSDQIQTNIGQMVWIQTGSEKSDQSGNSVKGLNNFTKDWKKPNLRWQHPTGCWVHEQS